MVKGRDEPRVGSQVHHLAGDLTVLADGRLALMTGLAAPGLRQALDVSRIGVLYWCSVWHGSASLRLVARPADTGHGHAALVFDGASRLHLPLTTFARKPQGCLSASSVSVYLSALLPFFTFLDGRGTW